MGGLFNTLAAVYFPKVIRPFFTEVVRLLYEWIANGINLIYALAKNDFGLGAEIVKFKENFFMIFVIYMVFKLSLSFLSFLVNPDSFSDKSNGGIAFLKRFVISIVLLVLITPGFQFLSDVQNDILNEGIIDNFVFGTDTDVYTLSESEINSMDPDIVDFAKEILKNSRSNHKYTLYTVKLSNHELCEGKSIITMSKGDRFSILVLRPFYQINSSVDDSYQNLETVIKDTNYCGIEFDESKGISTSDLENVFKSHLTYIAASNIRVFSPGILGAWQTFAGNGSNADIPTDAKSLLGPQIYNASVGNHLDDYDKENQMVIDYNYIWALIVGFIVFLLIITYCFDIVIRAFTLFLYQLVAPIPVISYVSPNKKDQEMLSTWLKKTFSVWAGLFIRIAILNFVMYIVPFICKNINISNLGFLAQIVVIIGMLMFAKKLPKLLEEIIPGLKLGDGLELNPFKRISKDALGGNMILGAGAGLAAAGLSGVTNLGTRALNRNTWRDANGNLTARSILVGLGRTAGSTIAGAARGGTNAFNRTRKDGHIVGGAWNGYQTAMFSKLIREDNLRKAGIINEDGSYAEGKGFFDRVGFGFGSVVADVNRYMGVLNEGQNEYLLADKIKKEIESQKFNINQRKKLHLEPYTQYMEVMQKMNTRIETLADEYQAVKNAKNALDDAIAAGGHSDAEISALRDALKTAKKNARRDIIANDQAVGRYRAEADRMRNLHTELQRTEFNYLDNGDFNKNGFLAVQGEAESIAYQYSLQENAVERQVLAANGIDEKRYAELQSENTVPKLQNAARANNEPQKAGFKPSGNESIQSRITDNSQYANFNGGGPRNGGPGPGPGGPRP